MPAHHLVIQAPSLSADTITQLARLSQARDVVRLNAQAARLTHVAPAQADSPPLRAALDVARVDAALVPAGVRLRDCRLLAMDMDSTLINIECIDEIADLAGKKAEVAAITAAAMRGEIRDFSESLTRRVALLRGVPVDILARVYTERLRLNPGAEALITAARAAGLRVMLVSGGFTYFTERLQTRLQLDRAHANVLDIEAGQLTGTVKGDILDAQTKARLLQDYAAELEAKPEHIIAIGDGANDLPMLAHAGYAVAYHAKPIVRQHARYALDVSGLDGVLQWFDA